MENVGWRHRTSLHRASTHLNSSSRYQKSSRCIRRSVSDSFDFDTTNCRSDRVGIGLEMSDEGNDKRLNGNIILQTGERKVRKITIRTHLDVDPGGTSRAALAGSVPLCRRSKCTSKGRLYEFLTSTLNRHQSPSSSSISSSSLRAFRSTSSSSSSCGAARIRTNGRKSIAWHSSVW
jgi:hypothetical protein